MFSADIGPKMEHTFLIENPGKTDLINLTLMLDLPMATLDGQPLLYLVPEAKNLARGSDTQFGE